MATSELLVTVSNEASSCSTPGSGSASRSSFRSMSTKVIVGPPDHPYRVLDLDEYADAIAAGDIDTATGVDGLRRTQTFLDRHLNRRHDIRRGVCPAFPPRAIAALAELPFDPRWVTVQGRSTR